MLPDSGSTPFGRELLTRSELLQRGAAVGGPLLLGASFLRTAEALARQAPPTLVISRANLARARANIFSSKHRFATRGWANTLAKANEFLGHEPSPTRPNEDVSDWRASIYLPGLHDGGAALNLALAYAIGGNKEHARQARAICLAWARTYNPAPSVDKIGHMVAEPVGPVIKLCMAYDLTKATFTADEHRVFKRWAAQFSARGKHNADWARDRPWVDDVTYEGDRSNPAPYGNGATWQRAMAVWAAAVVGERTLKQTLDWNFQHTTPGGRDYGWDNLLEGLVIDGGGGQVTEDRYRSSVVYGHFSWMPLVVIADLARNAGFRVDLFDYRTKLHGYTVFTPVAYYSQFLTRGSISDSYESSVQGGSAWPSTAARLRAEYEVLYRNATHPALVRTLRDVVSHGGPRTRGDNYDAYVFAHAAVLGRGPKGPGAKA